MTAIAERSVDEVLDRAADVIDDRGWTRGTFHSGDGRVCMVGAIRLVCQLRIVQPSAYTVVPGTLGGYTKDIPESDPEWYLSILQYLMNYLGDPPAWWNDEVCKDRGEVANTLRLAAKQYREDRS